MKDKRRIFIVVAIVLVAFFGRGNYFSIDFTQVSSSHSIYHNQEPSQNFLLLSELGNNVLTSINCFPSTSLFCASLICSLDNNRNKHLQKDRFFSLSPSLYNRWILLYPFHGFW